MFLAGMQSSVVVLADMVLQDFSSGNYYVLGYFTPDLFPDWLLDLS